MYLIPNVADIVEVVLRVLAAGHDKRCYIPYAIVQEYGLIKCRSRPETGEIGSQIE